MIKFEIDTEIEVPVNIMALIDKDDYRARVTDVVYDSAGLVIVWNFLTITGVYSQTEITPSESGDYEWVNKGGGMYGIVIPASGGATVNNNKYGFGWITGTCDLVLPFSGAMINIEP